MPRKKDIIEVYSDKEHEQLINYLNKSDISKRDKAICLLSIETGLRAIDISNLKLDDVDWKNEVIHLVQEKTNHAIDIPLRPSYR
ncbi:tyrosine-type recombinase/integrase [Clostridium aceticum]